MSTEMRDYFRTEQAAHRFHIAPLKCQQVQEEFGVRSSSTLGKQKKDVEKGMKTNNS